MNAAIGSGCVAADPTNAANRGWDAVRGLGATAEAEFAPVTTRHNGSHDTGAEGPVDSVIRSAPDPSAPESAKAISGAPIIPPTPSATANPPTRPTCHKALTEISIVSYGRQLPTRWGQYH
ncbi:hypothetical protein GCM10023114_13360 [Mycolicibacterium sediminis]|uniref:Uncharacterized protein n=1 Tax=Mycolicibacterium sediminis TaxID=1286180 RepID=A0A7I7QQE3_9MYCO|nr:hypothetical protein MSEDJ_23860 [Mycolicibacterium sediminis]